MQSDCNECFWVAVTSQAHKLLLQTKEFCYQNCIYQELNACRGGEANNVLENEEKGVKV